MFGVLLPLPPLSPPRLLTLCEGSLDVQPERTKKSLFLHGLWILRMVAPSRDSAADLLEFMSSFKSARVSHLEIHMKRHCSSGPFYDFHPLDAKDWIQMGWNVGEAPTVSP